MPTPLFAWACRLDIGEHAQAKAAWAATLQVNIRALNTCTAQAVGKLRERLP
jgi:hypothetical protein